MPATRRALVTIQANGTGDLPAAVEDLTHLLQQTCGGRINVVIANAGQPVVDLALSGA